jgi:hypothetical protein
VNDGIPNDTSTSTWTGQASTPKTAAVRKQASTLYSPARVEHNRLTRVSAAFRGRRAVWIAGSATLGAKRLAVYEKGPELFSARD